MTEPLEPGGPPAWVPTLTDVVHPPPAPQAVSDAQELLPRHVLQRIDRALDQRLPQAIERVVREHAEALMPRLRQEIERLVRESVDQALQEESRALPQPCENGPREAS